MFFDFMTLHVHYKQVVHIAAIASVGYLIQRRTWCVGAHNLSVELIYNETMHQYNNMTSL
jgi:CTP:phosphocholine cytidylyltransferase-like protein